MKKKEFAKNILFIQNNIINESFVLCDIISFLKSNDHKVELLIANTEKNLLKRAIRFNPDLIILPCPLADKKWYYEISKELKNIMDCKVLFWGSLATFYPQDILLDSKADFICRGEGEYAINELAQNLNKPENYKNILNLGFIFEGKIIINPLRKLVENLDELPMPDRSFYFRHNLIRNLNMRRFITSRGCTELCSACWNNSINNVYDNPPNFYRRKSADRVINEILEVTVNYKTTSVHFSDDLFVQRNSKEWLSDFLTKYRKKVGIPFSCNIRPDLIDEELIVMLSEANCRAVAMSIESGCQMLRNKKLNKKITDDDIIKASKLLKKYKIKILTFNVMGVPGENIDDIIKTIELNNKIRSDYTRLNIIFPLPLSDLSKDISKNHYPVQNIKNLSQIHDQLECMVFTSEHINEYKNIYYLFSLSVRLKLPVQFIKFLIKLPAGFFYKLLWFINTQLNEKKFFDIDLVSGINYMINSGGTAKRSENFTSIY